MFSNINGELKNVPGNQTEALCDMRYIIWKSISPGCITCSYPHCRNTWMCNKQFYIMKAKF